MSRLGQRLDRDFEAAIDALDAALDEGAISEQEHQEHFDAITAAHDRADDTAAENLKEFGRD